MKIGAKPIHLFDSNYSSNKELFIDILGSRNDEAFKVSESKE